MTSIFKILCVICFCLLFALPIQGGLADALPGDAISMSATAANLVNTMQGTWVSGSPCQSFSVGFKPSGNSFQLTESSDMTESVLIRAPGDGAVVNRGRLRNQNVILLEYEQFARDSAGNIGHAEVGQFLFETDGTNVVYKLVIDITRSITYYLTGTFKLSNAAPSITDISTTPTTNGNNPNLKANTGVWGNNFTTCSAVQRNNPNLALKNQNLGKSSFNTFELKFDSFEAITGDDFVSSQFQISSISSSNWVSTFVRADTNQIGSQIQHSNSLKLNFLNSSQNTRGVTMSDATASTTPRSVPPKCFFTVIDPKFDLTTI